VASLPDCKTLLLAREGSTLRVTINRPETRNALTAEVVGELSAVADTAGADSTLRTVVLRGADGTFCAGGDIKGFRQSFEAAPPRPDERDPIALNNRKFGDFLIKFNELPQTVVGVIEGAAFGGGLGLVCVTDIAICAADTKFALSETGLGIPPAQIAPFVVQRVGLTTARRIALSGARFDGAQAKQIGLVHFAEPDATALETRLIEVLGQINRCAPGANAATKQIMLNSMRLPVDVVLDGAADAFARQLRGDEGREGVRAFLEKRPAAWVEPDA
jgi:isohexenylglutaconyl-CoA hydratase